MGGSMYIFTLAVSLLFLLGNNYVRGDNCQNLVGYWYNSLGSEMMLEHNEMGELKGEYRTAVERKPGSAGTSHSNVTGAAPYNTAGATFGFMVSWRSGKSTTVWTGQCIVCDGEEVIVTTWLLRSLVDTCIDKWKSTYIGQDYFTRQEQTTGPRKRFGTHTPQGYDQEKNSGRKKRHVFENQYKAPMMRVKRQTQAGSEPCALDGIWYNLIGSKIDLKENVDHDISGEYRTSREVFSGKSSGHHSRIYGVGNYGSVEHTFAMLVSWRNGASLTGWVGQCHICTDSNNGTSALLEMAWLHRSKVDSCAANWKSTLHGQNTFYREVQQPDERVSDDIIGEFGEEEDSAACSLKMVSHLLIATIAVSCNNLLFT